MESIRSTVVTALVLVGLLALPAASENLSEQETVESVETANNPVEVMTRTGPDSFVKEVSTAFESFKTNTSRNQSSSTLETPNYRIETFSNPGETVKKVESDQGVLKKINSSSEKVTVVEAPEGRLVEKIVDGEKVVKFTGINKSEVESAKQILESNFDERLSEIQERKSTNKPESNENNDSSEPSSIELYVQPDTSLGEGEYVEIRNLESEALDLESWRIEDENGASYTFEPGEIDPGNSAKLYTNSTAGEYNWGRGLAVWNSDGDTAYLYDKEDSLISEYSY